MKIRVLLLALLLLLSACATDTPAATEPSQVNAIVTEIQDTMRKEPGVRTASAVYQNSMDAAAAGGITVTAEAGSDLDAIYDRAVELFWRSKLQPLSTLTISVTDETGKGSGRGGVRFKDQTTKDDLTKRYGARPVG